jgi:hypothetical protein
MQIDPDVGSIGDLEPVALVGVRLPPCVELSRDLRAVSGFDGCFKDDTRWRRIVNACTFDRSEHGPDERTAVT